MEIYGDFSDLPQFWLFVFRWIGWSTEKRAISPLLGISEIRCKVRFPSLEFYKPYGLFLRSCMRSIGRQKSCRGIAGEVMDDGPSIEVQKMAATAGDFWELHKQLANCHLTSGHDFRVLKCPETDDLRCPCRQCLQCRCRGYVADISRLKGDRVPEKASDKASEKLGETASESVGGSWWIWCWQCWVKIWGWHFQTSFYSPMDSYSGNPAPVDGLSHS